MRSERLRPGFALPAVLAVTGVVTIIFLVAMTALYSLTSEAASARARVRFLQQAMSAEAALSYMVATEPMSARGVNIGAARSLYDDLAPSPGDSVQPGSGVAAAQVMLDGRSYRMVAHDLVMQMRDQAGMINLARLSWAQSNRLAEFLGGDSRGLRTIGPKYLDYIDLDDLRQTGGAERSDYASVGESGPANRPLRRVAEWLSILGVRRSIEGHKWRTLQDHLANDVSSGSINVNTASPEALQILFGATQIQAEAAIRSRDAAPFVSLQQFSSITGIAAIADDESIYTFPNGRFWISVQDEKSAWAYRARLILRPQDQERPVWIDQTDMLEAPRRQPAEVKNVPGFPYAPR